MTLPPEAWVVPLVLLAAVLHATWNSLVKVSKDRLSTQALVIGVASVLGLATIPWVEPPAEASWPFLAISIVLHTGYLLFLTRAYGHGDLGQVYPLARGSAPLLVAVFAAIFAGERLVPVEMLGVGMVSLGIVSLGRAGTRTGDDGRAVIYALITGVFIAAYSVVDGMGIRRAGSAYGFIAWNFFLVGLPMVAITAWRRGRKAVVFLQGTWRRGVIGGLIATLGYAIVLWAMSLEGLAHVVALRETSVVLAAVIGTFLLGERRAARRFAAVALVAIGNLLLRLGG